MLLQLHSTPDTRFQYETGQRCRFDGTPDRGEQQFEAFKGKAADPFHGDPEVLQIGHNKLNLIRRPEEVQVVRKVMVRFSGSWKFDVHHDVHSGGHSLKGTMPAGLKQDPVTNREERPRQLYHSGFLQQWFPACNLDQPRGLWNLRQKVFLADPLPGGGFKGFGGIAPRTAKVAACGPHEVAREPRMHAFALKRGIELRDPQETFFRPHRPRHGCWGWGSTKKEDGCAPRPAKHLATGRRREKCCAPCIPGVPLGMKALQGIARRARNLLRLRAPGLGGRPKPLPGNVYAFSIAGNAIVPSPGQEEEPHACIRHVAAALRRRITGQRSIFDWLEVLPGQRHGLRGPRWVVYAVRAEPESCPNFLIGLTDLSHLPHPRALYAAARQLHRAGLKGRPRGPSHANWPSNQEDGSALNSARRKVQELSSLIARVAHDIRLPISALRATTAALGMSLPNNMADGPAARDRINRLNRQIRSLENFCNDMLAVHTGRSAPVENRPVLFGDVVAEALEAYEDVVAVRALLLSSEGHSELPVNQCVEGITHNLLHNATRHARRRIWLQIGTTGEAAYLDLEDDGLGLPAEAVIRGLSKQNIGRGGTGWGFGLESAVRAAEEAGGALRAIEPRHGTGARFLLVLPRAEAHVRRIGDGGNLAQE